MIARALKDAGAEAGHLTAGLAEAQELAGKLRAKPTDYRLITATVERVDLRADGFTTTLTTTLAGFATQLSGATQVRMKRRGNELRLVVPGAHREMKADPALLKALSRAHRWFAEVVGGKSIRAIAKAEGIGPVYVSRVLPLALLAPSITEAIMHGEQPATLSSQQLLTRTRLHPSWQKQRLALGFA